MDIAIFKLIHFTFKNDFFDLILPYCRMKTTWIPLYVFFLFYLYKNYSQKYWKIILLLILTVGLSDLLCANVLKIIFERPRPCLALANMLWYSDFGLCSQTFSFPSCHAMNHTALAVLLLPYFKRIGQGLLVIWVLLIGYSQIYVGVHYPSDILGGIVFGSILAYIVREISSRINFMET